MDEDDFEGTEVLETVAAHHRLDEFMAAVDADDVEAARSVMRAVGLHADMIEAVIEKMRAANGED